MVRFVPRQHEEDRLRILRPNVGARIIFHGWDDMEYVLLYLFRRLEGAHVVLDLLSGAIVDIGQFNEGTDGGTFQYYSECVEE